MSKKKIFDLEERTAVFGEDIIKLAKSVKPDHINRPVLTQLVNNAGQVRGRTIVKPMGRNQEKIFSIRWEFSKRMQRIKTFSKNTFSFQPGVQGEMQRTLARSSRAYPNIFENHS